MGNRLTKGKALVGGLDIPVGKLSIGGVAVTATANEINTGTVSGLTADATELNKLDGVVAGTVSASKAVVVGASKDVDTLDIIAPKINGVALSATAAELNKNAGVTGGQAIASKAVVTDANVGVSGLRRIVNLAAATQTLTALQSGQKFVGAVDAVFTLPAAAAGTKGVSYEFECGALSSGTGLSISPNSADHIRGNGLTAVDDKDLINTGASDRLGDMVRLYCDGVDGWVIEAVIGTFAKEA